MRFAQLSHFPGLGLSVAHRTTREWRFGGSTQRDGEGLPTSIGRLAGVAAGLVFGAGLTLLFSPEARASARRALTDALSDRRMPSGPAATTTEKASIRPPASTVGRANGTLDSEDADACDSP